MINNNDLNNRINKSYCYSKFKSDNSKQLNDNNKFEDKSIENISKNILIENDNDIQKWLPNCKQSSDDTNDYFTNK